MASVFFDWIRGSALDRGSKTAYTDIEHSVTFSDIEKLSAAAATWVAKRSEIERPVAVMGGRNVYTPACYMGVARAGCFYAAMDPEVPHARLEQIMSVTQPKLLIVDREHLETAQSLAGDHEIAVMEEVFKTEPDDALVAERERSVTEMSPLYMIFTSGSYRKSGSA